MVELLEGSEIVNKTEHYQALISDSWQDWLENAKPRFLQAWYTDMNYCEPALGWHPHWMAKKITARTFESPCSMAGSNRTWSQEWYTSYLNAAAPSNCVAEATVAAMDGNWVLDTTNGRTTNSSDRAWQPANRGLRVGWVDEFDEVSTDGAAHDYAVVKPRWVRDEGSMVSRWPMNYVMGKKVLLTFENVKYPRWGTNVFEAGRVKYAGQSPVVVTTNGATFDLSYLVTKESGTLTVGLTLDAPNSYDHDTGWFTKGTEQERTNSQYSAQHVSFTGFHNQQKIPTAHVTFLCGWAKGNDYAHVKSEAGNLFASVVKFDQPLPNADQQGPWRFRFVIRTLKRRP